MVPPPLDERHASHPPGGRARAGGDDDGCRPELADLVDRHRVVPAHDDVRPKLTQILDEVVGERIVVVDDEKHGRPCRPTDTQRG